MENNIFFRKANLDDLDEIFSFVKKSIDRMIQQKIYQWDEIYPVKSDFESDIKNGWLTCGIMDGTIVSTYSINDECDEAYNYALWNWPDSRWMVLHRIVVNPDFQNQGIGTRTMLHLMNGLKENGIQSLRLDVFSENPYSQRMYDKLGFVKTGEAHWRKGLFYLLEKKLQVKVTGD